MNFQYRLQIDELFFCAGGSKKSGSLGSLQIFANSEPSEWFVGGLVLAAPAVVDAAAFDAATAVVTKVGSLLNSQMESPLVFSLLISADRIAAGVVVPQLLDQHCTEVGSLFNPQIESPLVYSLLISADRNTSFNVRCVFLRFAAATAVGAGLIAARVLMFALFKRVLSIIWRCLRRLGDVASDVLRLA